VEEDVGLASNFKAHTEDTHIKSELDMEKKVDWLASVATALAR